MSYPVATAWSNEDTTNAFDASGAPWFLFGVNTLGPKFSIRDRNEITHWNDPSAQSVIIDYGRQRPYMLLSYYLWDFVPVYMALGAGSTTNDVHTITQLAEDARLPEFQVRYQDIGGLTTDTIIQMMNCKTHSLKLSVDRKFPMMAHQIMMGTDRWIADNTYWQDGVTAATGLTTVMNDPTLWTGVDIAAGFYLDHNSTITINGISVNDYCLQSSFSLANLTSYIYQSDDTFQEEVFPSEIFETIPPLPLACDFDLMTGVENSLIKDIMDNDAFTISATYYSDDAKTRYMTVDMTTSAYNSEAYISIPNPNNPRERVTRLRFMGDHSISITGKDGASALPTFQ